MNSYLPINNSKRVILFDLISTQGSINGGAEFTVKILKTTLQRFNNESHELIFLFDSRIPFFYESSNPINLQKNFSCTCVDIAKNNSISNIIDDYKVNVFFVGIGQRLEFYSLENINCETYIVFHDLSNIEIEDNHLDYFLLFKSQKKSFKQFLRLILNYFSLRRKKDYYFNPFQFAQKENVTILTVSEYSKFSLKYYFPEIKKDIIVIHSPEKLVDFDKIISNENLDMIIKSKMNYFLIVGADRFLKNVEFTSFVFEKFSRIYPEFILVTVGTKGKQFPNHIGLPYLTASDLDHAIKNSYCLIYASLFEGYGYPPIEAMKYGRPIIASNICSIPEILADAPIYFSPFYRVDLMKALINVISNHEFYSKKSMLRYLEIKELQLRSTDILVNLILKLD